MAEKRDADEKKPTGFRRLAKMGGRILMVIGAVSGVITILTYVSDLTWAQIITTIKSILNLCLPLIVLCCLGLLIYLCAVLRRYVISDRPAALQKNDVEDLSKLCIQLSESINKLLALQTSDFDELSKICTSLTESVDKLSTLQKVELGELSKVCTRFSENHATCRDNLKTIEGMQTRMSKYGIVDMRARDDYNNDFYKTIYSHTANTLIISGHSLNNTISSKKAADLRQAFMRAIIQVLRNDGTVKILLQNVDPNDNIARGKRSNFISFITDLIAQIARISAKENWKNIDVIGEHLLIKQVGDLRYFIVQTDTVALISHYKMAQHNENKNIYVFQVDPSGSFGALYLNDFDYVFDKKSTFIEEANKQIKKLTQGGKANG